MSNELRSDLMKIYHATAFPKEPHGGNKAGVVVFADTMTDEEMQVIAANLGYSETAFVMHSDEADFSLRFFTPTKEVDLCGHATIASFNLLRDEGYINTGIYTQKTKAGLLRLEVEDDLVSMEQLRPRYYEKLSDKDVQSMFEGSVDLHPTLPVEVVSTGLKEIFLPVASKEALDALKPKFGPMTDFCLSIGAIGVHAFCVDESGVDALSRNFAPVVGIEEESATGTSNGALGCYLFKHHTKKEIYHMEQGLFMKQPSSLVVRLKTIDDYIEEVWVGGPANILRVEE